MLMPYNNTNPSTYASLNPSHKTQYEIPQSPENNIYITAIPARK